MGYRVSFVIDGTSTGGVNAVDAIDKALGKIANSKAFETVEAQASRLWGTLGSVNNALKSMRENIISLSDHQGFKSLTEGLAGARGSALATARAVRTMAEALDRVSARSIRGIASGSQAVAQSTTKAATAAAQLARAQAQAANATNQAALSAARLVNYQTGIAAKTQQAQIATSGWAVGLRAVEATAGRLLMTFGKVVAASGQIAKGVSIPFSRMGVQGAGPIQSLGIATRMWGINFGNQLSSAGSGGPIGIAKMVPGILASVSELGVRVVTALAGFGIKAGGLFAQGILGVAGGILRAGLGGIFGSFGKLIGSGVSGLLSAAGNILTAFTNLAGEAVTQIGNVFTGLAEAARGALQGALNAAGEMFGTLYSVAERVVGKIASVFGTLGKLTLGTAGVLTGFAARDVIGTEQGLGRGLVLLDDKMTPKQTTAMKSWVHDMAQKFGEFSREQIGNAWARVVGTGFSNNPEQAKKIASSALKLSFASGYPNESEEAARVLAKSLSIFGDEFKDSDAQADAFFQTISQGDLTLGGLTENLSHTMGAAKAMGVSLKELLVLIAQMSMTAGQEETSTGLRRLLLEPLKFTDKGLDLLKSKGIDTNAYLGGSSPETEAIQGKIDALKKRLSFSGGRNEETKEAKARAALRKTEIAQEIQLLTIKERGLKGPAKAAIRSQIDQLRLESTELNKGILGLEKGEGAAKIKQEIKALTAQLKEAAAAAGDIKNLPELLDRIARANYTAAQLHEMFPDLRALSAMLILRGQNPELAAKIKGHIVNASGSIDQGSAVQSDKLGNKFQTLWTSIKSPFEASLLAIEGRLKSFLDWATEGFVRLGKWWGEALAAPGATAFIDNITAKIQGLFGITKAKGGLFESLFAKDGSAQGIEKFWTSMNSGLDTAWNFAGKVVTAFETLYGWIVKIVEKTGADSFFGKIGGAIGSAASWVGGTAGQLSEGDTSNLDDMVKKITDTWDYVWGKGHEIFDYGYAKLTGAWDAAKSFWSTEVVPKIDSWFSTAETLAKISAGAAAAGALFNLMRLLGGGGGGGAPGGGGGGPGWNGGGVLGPAGKTGKAVGGFLNTLGRAVLIASVVEIGGETGKALGEAIGRHFGLDRGPSRGGIGMWSGMIENAKGMQPGAARDSRFAGIAAGMESVKPGGADGQMWDLWIRGLRNLIGSTEHFEDAENAAAKALEDIAARAQRDADHFDAKHPIGARTPGVGSLGGSSAGLAYIAHRLGQSPGPLGLPSAASFAGILTAHPDWNPDEIERKKQSLEGTLRAHRLAATVRGQIDAARAPGTLARMGDALTASRYGLSYSGGTQSPDAASHPYAPGKGWYDDGAGELRGKRTMHSSIFGVDTGPGWKKLRHAERDPNFEGGRWERFTSRGIAAEEARRAASPDAAAAKAAADKTLDPQKAEDAVSDQAGALTDLKKVLETLIKGGETNNGTLIALVKDAITKLDGSDEAQKRDIDSLKKTVDALSAAKAAAGQVGGAAGGTN